MAVKNLFTELVREGVKETMPLPVSLLVTVISFLIDEVSEDNQVLDQLEDKIDKLNQKLDQHILETYRVAGTNLNEAHYAKNKKRSGPLLQNPV